MNLNLSKVWGLYKEYDRKFQSLCIWRLYECRIRFAYFPTLCHNIYETRIIWLETYTKKAVVDNEESKFKRYSRYITPKQIKENYVN